MIYYKSFRLLSESHGLHPTLRELLDDFACKAVAAAWKKIVVTSIYRTVEENRAARATTLVHCQTPHRAIDIRIRDVPAAIVASVGQSLVDEWEYDRRQPRLNVALWKLHGSGPHLHLQVHPNTRRRPK